MWQDWVVKQGPICWQWGGTASKICPPACPAVCSRWRVTCAATPDLAYGYLNFTSSLTMVKLTLKATVNFFRALYFRHISVYTVCRHKKTNYCQLAVIVWRPVYSPAAVITAYKSWPPWRIWHFQFLPRDAMRIARSLLSPDVRLSVTLVDCHQTAKYIFKLLSR